MSKELTTLRIPAQERNWLKRQAAHTGLTISDIVRLSIRQSMESGAIRLAFDQGQPALEAPGDGQRHVGA